VDRIYTLEEVGDKFNLSREAIRQRESKALRKIYHLARSDKFRYLDSSVGKFPYDGYGFHEQVLERKKIDIWIDEMKENTLSYSDFLKFFENLDKRYHEYFYQELRVK
jgi:hypothetical protein